MDLGAVVAQGAPYPSAAVILLSAEYGILQVNRLPVGGENDIGLTVLFLDFGSINVAVATVLFI